jgi:hypothetical protein
MIIFVCYLRHRDLLRWSGTVDNPEHPPPCSPNDRGTAVLCLHLPWLILKPSIWICVSVTLVRQEFRSVIMWQSWGFEIWRNWTQLRPGYLSADCHGCSHSVKAVGWRAYCLKQTISVPIGQSGNRVDFCRFPSVPLAECRCRLDRFTSPRPCILYRQSQHWKLTVFRWVRVAELHSFVSPTWTEFL